jgi:hypothetical protein
MIGVTQKSVAGEWAMEPGKVTKPMHGAVPMLELVVEQRRREEFERAAEMRLIKDAQARQRMSATQALRQRVGLSLVRTGSRMIANDDHAEAA